MTRQKTYKMVSPLFLALVACMMTACGGSLPVKMSANTTFDKPDEQLSVNGRGIDMFTSSKTIMVPGVYVQTMVRGEQKASNNGAHSKTSVVVKGITNELGQTLATALYQDLIKRLRDSGWTVLTYQDIKSDPKVAEDVADIDHMPFDKDLGFIGFEKDYTGRGDKTWMMSSPKGIPVFDFDFTGNWPPISDFEKIGRAIGATPVLPRYVFTAPVMYSETGRGYKRSIAKTGLVPAMEMRGGYSYIIYPYGSIAINHNMRLSENIGTIEKVSASSSENRTLFIGNVFRTMSKGSYVMNLDIPAYKKAALQAGKDLNKAAVEAINAALPKNK